MWIERKISNKINILSSSRPAILITGVRQAGKSSLLKRLFQNASYVTLDHIAKAEHAEQNPHSFLSAFNSPVLLDEIQYAPSLFRELKIFIDENREKYGHWILTGSQKFQLMKNISESLAGRIGILTLETLCAEEIKPYSQMRLEDLPWKGGYPELWSNPHLDVTFFFEDYVQTYLERDLKSLINVTNLRDFQRCMKILATRVGQIVNYTDIAKDIGISPVTIKNWINALECSGIIYMLSPYYKNMGKRLIKTPKLFFSDNGLLCHLLDINHEEDYLHHLYRGQIWENFVFTELVKTHNFIPNKSMFFYRDQNGVEIDFVLEKKQKISLIEAKHSEKITTKKLNLKKIVPLFAGDSKSTVNAYVACTTHEKTLVELKQYSMFNPLYCTQVFHHQA